MDIVQFWQLFGWQSRDDVAGKEWSFIYSENIDNISSTQYIQVSRTPETIWTWDEKITHVLECYTSRWDGPILLFGQKGTVWDSSIPDPLYKFQIEAVNLEVYIASWRPIYKYVSYASWEVFYIAPLPIKNTEDTYTLSFSDVLFKNYTDMSRRWGDEFLGDGTMYFGDWSHVWDRILTWNHWSLRVWIFLYVYIRRDIYKINLNTGYTENFNIASWDIAWMTYQWWTFKIYEHSGLLYLWDGKSENPSQFFDIETSLEKVGTMKSVDYVTSKEGVFFLDTIICNDIYLAHDSEYVNHRKFKTEMPNKDNLVSSNWLLLLLEKIENDWGHRVIVFGNKISWSPKSYTNWHIASNYKEVFQVAKWMNGVYISYEDFNWDFWVDFYNLFEISKQNKQESWSVILREFKSIPKQRNRKPSKLSVFVWWLLTENDKIKFFSSINKWEFKEFFELNSETVLDRWRTWWWAFDITKFNKEFHTLTFKIELNGDAILYDLDMNYD